MKFLIDESSCTTVIVCGFCGDWRCIDLTTEQALAILFEHVATVAHTEPTAYLLRLVRAHYTRRGLQPWERLERLAKTSLRNKHQKEVAA